MLPLAATCEREEEIQESKRMRRSGFGASQLVSHWREATLEVALLLARRRLASTTGSWASDINLGPIWTNFFPISSRRRLLRVPVCLSPSRTRISNCAHQERACIIIVANERAKGLGPPSLGSPVCRRPTDKFALGAAPQLRLASRRAARAPTPLRPINADSAAWRAQWPPAPLF